jgi:hypothetical protein
VEECGPCPVFASFTLAFVSQLRKKHGKTSVKVVIHIYTMNHIYIDKKIEPKEYERM